MSQTHSSPVPATPPTPGTAYPLILQCLDYTVDLIPHTHGLNPCTSGELRAVGHSQSGVPDPLALRGEHLDAVAMADAAVESAEWELDRARHAQEAAVAAARLAGIALEGPGPTE